MGVPGNPTLQSRKGLSRARQPGTESPWLDEVLEGSRIETVDQTLFRIEFEEHDYLQVNGMPRQFGTELRA